MGDMTIVEAISQVGFPIAVAVWFMLRFERRLDRCNELQSAQLQALAVLTRVIDADLGSRITSPAEHTGVD